MTLERLKKLVSELLFLLASVTPTAYVIAVFDCGIDVEVFSWRFLLSFLASSIFAMILIGWGQMASHTDGKFRGDLTPFELLRNIGGSLLALVLIHSLIQSRM